MNKPHIPEPAFPLGHTEAAMYASCIENLMNPNIGDAERAHLTAKAKALCGLTKQEYFAAKAMQAATTGHIAHYGHESHWPVEGIASYAYELSEAIIQVGETP